MSVTYVFWHYHCKMRQTFETVEEAIDAAAADHSFGYAAYDVLLDEQGNVLMDHDTLRRAVWARSEELDL